MSGPKSAIALHNSNHSLRPSVVNDLDSLKRELSAAYRMYREQLFICALSITGDRQVAEDAIHEVFRRLLSNACVPRNFRSYLCRAVRNAAIDIVRRRKQTLNLDDVFVVDSLANPQEAAEQRQLQEYLANELARLSHDQRETVMQHLYGGMTFREIADMRDAPFGTVTSWYRRGIERLRMNLEIVHE